MIKICNVRDAIASNDTVLDGVIQQLIDDWQLSVTVEQWRLYNYSDLRRWAYPDTTVLLDAQVKIESGDQQQIVIGKEELAQYSIDCLSVKVRFPKPAEVVPTADQIRQAAIAQLEAERDEKLWGGFTCQMDGTVYPCDQIFQNAIGDYLTAYQVGLKQPEETFKVRTFDNSFRYLNQAELKQLGASLLPHVQSIWDEFWAAKDML